jgi:hypothetical protein
MKGIIKEKGGNEKNKRMRLKKAGEQLLEVPA